MERAVLIAVARADLILCALGRHIPGAVIALAAGMMLWRIIHNTRGGSGNVG